MKTKNHPLICLVGCSIRCVSDQKHIVEQVKKLPNETLLYEYIGKTGRAKKISNSEGGLIASSFGAHQWSNRLQYIRLNEYFLRDGRVINVDSLLKKLQKADGIIFASPVYFGDRSSLLHEFIRICKKKQIDFSGKICASVSVGAKRNGGQETTIIYILHSFTELGALVVGNGPPTSQYGGTCVGGNMGTMENDYFGILTSTGVGKRVGQIATLLKGGRRLSSKTRKKIGINFWILEDAQSQVEKYVTSIIKRLTQNNKDIKFKKLNLAKYKFNRCFACDKCPNTNNKSMNYKCINKNDDMEKIYPRLLEGDAIILVGLSLKNISKIKSVYQKFTERTRFIRRDDFKLTNKLIMALSLNEIGSNSLFNVKTLTSYIRHNTVFHKGIREYIYNNEILEQTEDTSKIFNSFIKYTKLLAIAGDKLNIGKAKYESIGY